MHPPSPQFYSGPGAFPGTPRPQAPAGPPIGSHNQFTPLQVAVTSAHSARLRRWVRTLTALLLRFVWQVTKKLVSAKKNHVTQEFYSAAQAAAKRQSDREETPQQHPTTSPPCPSPGAPAATTGSPTAVSQHTPPKQKAPSTGGTPGSASKRRHRKLAVSFEAAKVSE